MLVHITIILLAQTRWPFSCQCTNTVHTISCVGLLQYCTSSSQAIQPHTSRVLHDAPHRQSINHQSLMPSCALLVCCHSHTRDSAAQQVSAGGDSQLTTAYRLCTDRTLTESTSQAAMPGQPTCKHQWRGLSLLHGRLAVKMHRDCQTVIQTMQGMLNKEKTAFS